MAGSGLLEEFGQQIGRRLVETAATRLGLHAVGEQEFAQVGQLREAQLDARLARRESQRLGREAISYVGQQDHAQDLEPDDRIGMARQGRYVAQRDAHVLLAHRLRTAFCIGRGIPKPEASDADVQVGFDEFWEDPDNQRELTTYSSQVAKCASLWKQCNIYPVVFDDGLDGAVRLGHLEHDSVVGAIPDPDVPGRTLYYKVRQYVPAPYDYVKHAPSRAGRFRIVYYESFEGMAQIEEEGRPAPNPPPANLLMPGRVFHVAINRDEEQVFGVPELRSNMKWAAAFNDIMSGQVEKAKSAQRFLMKVKAKGATTGNRLLNAALNVTNRRSPLGNSSFGEAEDPVASGVKPGGELWENDTLTAEPFALESGGAAAAVDMQGAVDAFAAGTNFPGYWFHGDPGSLAGATGAELPVLKLTDADQEMMEGVVRRLMEHVTKRRIAVGLLAERRTPTPEELAANADVGPDGLIERDLSFEVKMPDALRRNLPEISQVIADAAATYDPMGQNAPLNRYLLGKTLTQLFDVSDPTPIVDAVFPEGEPLPAPDPANPPPAPAPSSVPPTSTGPDNKRHTGDNPYGARRQASLIEASIEALAARMATSAAARAREHDEAFGAALGGGGR